MSSLAVDSLSSLLVFGHQTEFPPEKVLQDFRLELISSSRLSALRDAVNELPHFWQSLIEFDPSLRQVPGDGYLSKLKQWIQGGGPSRHREINPPNHYALAFSVLLHVTQYSRYLDLLGKDSHRKVLDSVKDGGIQGFCVGFLSAVAVALSESEDDLGPSAAIALRLAVCIGAYVDRDGKYSPAATEYSAIALRWREGNADDKTEVARIIESIPSAYISSINDDASATITIRSVDLSSLTKRAHDRNLRTKAVHVSGRFHTPDHSNAVDKLLKLASLSKGLAFPDAKELKVPLRDTTDGENISGGSLTRVALENTLTNAADWFSTLKSSIQQLPMGKQTIAIAGFGDFGGPKPILEEAPNGHVNGHMDVHVNGVNGIHGPQESLDLSQYPSHSIAVVGMAGRFPGAETVDELWDLILEGKTIVERAPVKRLGLPQTAEHADTKWWGNFLKDPDAFDHKFFKKSFCEALAWDPYPFDHINLAATGFLSPSGQYKPFNADADGYCRGKAVAVVVLKPLKDAIQEDDNILGVITGSAVNQSHNFGHIAAPNSDSQTDLYRKVMKLGGVEPDSITYVEAHGPGTGVGDPIEVRSIRDAFGGPQRDSLVHFGSIKGNIGHTEATAGIAGLIKILHKRLNPKIPAFDQHQMAISRATIPWQAPSLLACVNSYGAAGSNSAVIVRQKPSYSNTRAPVELSKYPLFISAGSANSLSRYSKKLLDWLKDAKAEDRSKSLSSVIFNLTDRGNHSLPHNFATTVSSVQDLQAKLEMTAAGSGPVITPAQEPKPVVLVFGGQESDFIGLSENVYQSSKLFRKHLDSVNDLLVPSGLESFYPSIFKSSPIRNLVTLHSALFAVQYASAKTWIDCGLKVSAIVGHSFGQLTAFCITDTLSLPDALKLVSGRALLMQKYWGSEPGSMLFLRANLTTVQEILRSLNGLYAEIACLNSPESHVVVGSSEAIQFLQQHIANNSHLRKSVSVKKLNVTNGFHSKFTEPMLPHLTSLAMQLEWKYPDIHLETTDEHESNTKPDFSIVSEHTRRPVFFQRAIERLTTKYSECTWIEAGRGSSVMQLVKLSVAESQGHAFHSPQLTSVNAQDSLTDITVDLWKSGHATQYWPFHRSQKLDYKYLSLPPIQFEKTRHWLGFTGRGSLKDDGPEAGKKDTEETHELFSFLDFRDGAKKGAVFRIDPQADRFKKMLGGHVMGGQSLAPASLYFEVVARAAMFLENDTQATTYVPIVDDLVMKSPIGQDTNKKISLVLEKLDDRNPLWSFSITTQDTGFLRAEAFEVSTGRVSLKKRDDASSARKFERFETLAGHRRCHEVMEHPDAEKMQGKHIYRAFNTVVCYGEPFHGIKKIACVGLESAGTVKVTPALEDAADQRLCDTPMTDSFMQFAGLMVNYFNNHSFQDVFVCGNIEHIELGGAFDPDAGEWLVYATMSENSETEVSADAYVFDARTKKMVMALFGLRFSKMSQSLLTRMLKSVNKSANVRAEAKEERSVNDTSPYPIEQQMVTPAAKVSSGKRAELLQILSNVTDIPLEDIKDETTLDDLSVDSLMATEVLNDIRSVLGVTIDLSSFLFFQNIRALISHVNDKLGVGGGKEDGPLDSVGSNTDTPNNNSGTATPETTTSDDSKWNTTAERPTIISAFDAFEETRLNYDKLAETTQAVNFWRKAYPHQARLVLAYVVEAFADLGCDLRQLRSGDSVPQVKTLDKHRRLVRQLYRVLENGGLVTPSKGQGTGFNRTDNPIDSTPAESIYHQIIDLYPQHARENKLVRAVGSEMEPCLRGDKEALQVIFEPPTLVLGDFLAKAFTTKASGKGKFRLLEIGAGTGGTTRYLINHLRSLGIDFEYVFTDISASLVSTAEKQFKGTEGLFFDVLDVEKPPKPEFQGAFHCVIASNTIHASRDLDVSLRNVRQLLREDGSLALIEITKQMFWLDIVFGLLEGWWLFEDGRRDHALVDERYWERRMKAAGFEAVSWSDGATPESKTIRVVAAFPTGGTAVPEKTVKAALETVVYKKIGDLEIHADPLMIHGGSHMLFSRKDVRPAQTRLLLRKGFLPVSLDYRLCPEATLMEGPMVDVCDALDWARNQLPMTQLPNSGLRIDGESVVVRGLRPPEAILSLYAPTDYEDEWWQHPIEPNGAPYTGQQYDLLEGIQDQPITNYEMVGAWEEPLSDPSSHDDPRTRIVLHINGKAQTLPIILGGLPSRKKAAAEHPTIDWNALP
ncbi:beta-ketoacyl synthase [Seiridium cupressi]